VGLDIGWLVARGAPIVGLAAIMWRAKEEEIREDARVFFRAGRRHKTLDRLYVLRKDLVREFEEVAKRWSDLDPTEIKTVES